MIARRLSPAPKNMLVLWLPAPLLLLQPPTRKAAPYHSDQSPTPLFSPLAPQQALVLPAFPAAAPVPTRRGTIALEQPPSPSSARPFATSPRLPQ